MIDWVEYLTDQKLIPPMFARSMREHQRSWREGKRSYHDFLHEIISAYQAIEAEIDLQQLREVAGAFVAQDRSYLEEGVVGSTLLQLFENLRVDVHIVSGGPLAVLREYRDRHGCIKRVTGISSRTAASSVLVLKQDVARIRTSSPVLFGIGDSETDIPLFETSHCPIGINFAPKELLAKGGLFVRASSDLRLSQEALIQLSSYVRACVRRWSDSTLFLVGFLKGSYDGDAKHKAGKCNQ